MKLFQSSLERGTNSKPFLQAGIYKLQLLQNISRVESRTWCPCATSVFGFASTSFVVLLEEHPAAFLTVQKADDGIWLGESRKAYKGSRLPMF